jgi:hypothetical protein
MKNLFVVATMFALLGVTLAQGPQRFPAPLGLDRVLTGMVSDCKVKNGKRTERDPRCKKNTTYLLTVGDTVYRLHGHEDELASRAGKTATVTGNVVENDVAVTAVKTPE